MLTAFTVMRLCLRCVSLSAGHKSLLRGQQDVFARLATVEQQQQSLIKELDDAQREEAAGEAAWQCLKQRVMSAPGGSAYKSA